MDQCAAMPWNEQRKTDPSVTARSRIISLVLYVYGPDTTYLVEAELSVLDQHLLLLLRRIRRVLVRIKPLFELIGGRLWQVTPSSANRLSV